MSREWVDDRKPMPRKGPDRRDKRWVMRCDCWEGHGTDRDGRLSRCATEGEPQHDQPDLKTYAEAGWFIAEVHGDRCPACLAAGHGPHNAPHVLMEAAR